MEPLRPAERDDLLRNRPLAAPADIDEYERLLSERFTRPPHLAGSPEKSRGDAAREVRLKELHKKLFGD